MRKKKETKEIKNKERQITEEDLEGKTEEEIEMMKLMGFASFDSTKVSKTWSQVHVPGGFPLLLSWFSVFFCCH